MFNDGESANFQREDFRHWNWYYIDFDVLNEWGESMTTEKFDDNKRILLRGNVFNLPFQKMVIETQYNFGEEKGRVPLTFVVFQKEMDLLEVVIILREKAMIGFKVWIKDNHLESELVSTADSIENPEVIRDFHTAELHKLSACLTYIISPKTYKCVESTGLGKKKRKGRIVTNKIIHVSKDKSTMRPRSKSGTIDFKHSFMVCGHWRKVSGLGKDRNGDYKVHGFTWVRPFTKGNGELVNKIRVLK